MGLWSAYVIQDTIINQSRIDSIVICGITTNMKKISWPGIVELKIDEGNLLKKSLVDVSQVLVVKKMNLGEFIGKLSNDRVKQIFSAMKLIQSLEK
ncbi:MAG: type II toxin-antitoxin system PemK/MazF family toxin [Spirochaetales bacterium]|nr:type II toxin-antitoxin system PemK/MazF family toxin [Spirochaetales bacterium]